MAWTHDRRQWAYLAGTFAAVFGLLAIVTFNDGRIQVNYLAGILLTVVIYAIFALGLSLQFGQTGLLNFGHVGFMLIGAYAYGILMMPATGRPSDAPGIVGALFDAAPGLAGGTPWGIVATLVASLVVAVLVAFPVLLVLRKIRGRFSRSGKGSKTLGVGVAVALGVAVLAFIALHPLTPGSALNVAVLLSVLIGMAAGALAGLLLGLPAIRLREDYLAIVTIGAAEILRSVVLNEEAWTRGSRTIVNFHRPLIEWALANEAWVRFANAIDVRPASFAVLVVSLTALVYLFVLLETLGRSPWGRVLRAIREDQEAAAALGKNVTAYKLQSLMVGGAIAALAGVLLVTSQAVVTPVAFLPIITFYAFIIVVIGGVGSHRGAVAGAILLWGIFALAQNLGTLGRVGLAAGPPQTIFVGVLLILVMMFRPQGLLGHKEEMLYAK